MTAAKADTNPLREALELFTSHYEPWMDSHPDSTECIVHARHTFGDLKRARAALASEPVAGTVREAMLELGEQSDPVREALRRMIAEFGDYHYHVCPADNDSGPCECFAGFLLVDAKAALSEPAPAAGKEAELAAREIDAEFARISGLYFDALNEITELKAALAPPAPAGGEEIARILNDHFWTGEPGQHDAIKAATDALLALSPHAGATTASAPEPVAWRYRNDLGEVVSEWIDGPPPEFVRDAITDERIAVSTMKIDVAYGLATPSAPGAAAVRAKFDEEWADEVCATWARVEEVREECAKIVDAECERILSKQTATADPLSMMDTVNANLRMMACVLPDIAKSIREIPLNIPDPAPPTPGAARPFYGAECPSYPNCEGGCGLGCTKEIERHAAPGADRSAVIEEAIRDLKGAARGVQQGHPKRSTIGILDAIADSLSRSLAANTGETGR